MQTTNKGEKMKPMDKGRFLDIREHGFARVAVVIPRVHLASPRANAEEHLKMLREVYEQGAMYALCPELGLTGYSCGDLFHSQALLVAANEALKFLVEQTRIFNMVISVGMPFLVDGALYNVAVSFCKGRVLAVVPKAYPPNYREFYEGRHFARAAEARVREVDLFGNKVLFGTDILISSPENPNFILHTDVCEDLWVPIPPGTEAALAGATVLANLSASNATIGKDEYRAMLVAASSGRNNAVQMYSAAGFGESTSGLAWDGHGIIAERGKILVSTKRFELGGTYEIVDVDLGSLIADRMRQTSQWQNASDHRKEFRKVEFNVRLGTSPETVYHKFRREIPKFPLVPSDPIKRDERCRDVFSKQSTSFARWLLTRPEHLRKAVIGVSGGRDSTHALLVAAHAMDLLKLPRTNIIAITMPGFGTTSGTYEDACDLSKAIGATFKEIDIKPISSQIMQSIGHDPANENVTFQNIQAWARKVVELALGADLGATDLGTGDLSELLVGYSTMFGDHAGHYGVNSGVGKTLISFLIQWCADVHFKDDQRLQARLHSILGKEISAELLTSKTGEITQKSEEDVGPYALIDFFGSDLIRYGDLPSKIIRICFEAWSDTYDLLEMKKRLCDFFERFFGTQLKRSTMPLGPKIGSVSVSPRDDWRMPADASPDAWINELDRVPDTL